MKTTEVNIVNNSKFAIYGIIFIVSGTLLTIFVSLQSRTLFVPIIGLSITFFAPLYFKKFFSFNGSIDIKDERLIIKMLEADKWVVIHELALENIKAFAIRKSSKSGDSFMKLEMRNGLFYSFRLVGPNCFQIADEVNDEIINFNSRKEDKGNKIKLLPSFFASRAGMIFIYLLTILLITAIIIDIVYFKTRRPYLLIPGIVMYIGILIQRKNDLELARKWNGD
jgi:hypothetical protein